MLFDTDFVTVFDAARPQLLFGASVDTCSELACLVRCSHFCLRKHTTFWSSLKLWWAHEVEHFVAVMVIMSLFVGQRVLLKVSITLTFQLLRGQKRLERRSCLVLLAYDLSSLESCQLVLALECLVNLVAHAWPVCYDLNISFWVSGLFLSQLVLTGLTRRFCLWWNICGLNCHGWCHGSSGHATAYYARLLQILLWQIRRRLFFRTDLHLYLA